MTEVLTPSQSAQPCTTCSLNRTTHVRSFAHVGSASQLCSYVRRLRFLAPGRRGTKGPRACSRVLSANTLERPGAGIRRSKLAAGNGDVGARGGRVQPTGPPALEKECCGQEKSKRTTSEARQVSKSSDSLVVISRKSCKTSSFAAHARSESRALALILVHSELAFTSNLSIRV